MKRYNVKLIIGFALLLFSCKNSNTIGVGEQHKEEVKIDLQKAQNENSVSNKRGILFLHFNVYNSKKGEVLALSKTEIAEGTSLKNDYGLLESALPSHLRCSFLNSKDEVVKNALLENPLVQRVEFSEDGKTIQSKIINKDSAYFFLRTNYNGDIHSVKVELIDSLGIGKELAHFNLVNFLKGDKK